MFRDLRDMIVVASWDLMKLKNQRVFLAMRIAWFTIQVLVFARAISAIVQAGVKGLVGGVDYYYFYLLGVYTALLYSTGISRGYIIADEFDDGVVEYHLSLPVKRSVFAVGRIIGSSLSALLFTLPMMLLVYAVLGVKDMLTVLISIGAAMVFSAGVVCFVLLVVLTFKSTDLTDILMGAIDALLVRLSTVFYPLPVVEATRIEPYYAVTLLNPISHLADFLRVMVFPEYHLVVKYGFIPSLIYLVGLAMGMLILAIEYYEKKLEAGGWK